MEKFKSFQGKAGTGSPVPEVSLHEGRLSLGLRLSVPAALKDLGMQTAAGRPWPRIQREDWTRNAQAALGADETWQEN